MPILLKLTRKGLCEAYRRDEPGPWRRGAFLLNVGPNFLDENLLLFIFLCPVIVVLVLNMTFRVCSFQNLKFSYLTGPIKIEDKLDI